MISIQAKKHDNYSVEFKFGFNCAEGRKCDDFSVNAGEIFVVQTPEGGVGDPLHGGVVNVHQTSR